MEFLIALFVVFCLWQGGKALNKWMNDSKCPVCKTEMEDSGYQGFKRWCPNCKWRNYGGGEK